MSHSTHQSEALVDTEPHQGRRGCALRSAARRAAVQDAVRWANSPRLRSDGVFLPDSRGVIATADGPVLFEMHGISLVPDEHDRRHLVGSLRFMTEAPELRYLLDGVAVFEGSLDVESGDVRIPVRLCRPDPDADCGMTQDGRPSRATPEGQVLAFLEGLTALTGTHRTAARIACALVLSVGAAAIAFGRARAVTDAFG